MCEEGGVGGNSWGGVCVIWFGQDGVVAGVFFNRLKVLGSIPQRPQATCR